MLRTCAGDCHGVAKQAGRRNYVDVVMTLNYSASLI